MTKRSLVHNLQPKNFHQEYQLLLNLLGVRGALIKRMSDGKDHRHISMKIPNFKFGFNLGFWCMCTDRSKPNVQIKMMSPYHSVQMSTQHRIWLWCMGWQQTVSNRNIEIEFDFGYFQWYMPMNSSEWPKFESCKSKREAFWFSSFLLISINLTTQRGPRSLPEVSCLRLWGWVLAIKLN